MICGMKHLLRRLLGRLRPRRPTSSVTLLIDPARLARDDPAPPGRRVVLGASRFIVIHR
jgi:hypothetical protein